MLVSGSSSSRGVAAPDSPGSGRRWGLSLSDLEPPVREQDVPGTSELDRYRALDRARFLGQGDDFDLLLWWNDHRSAYPTLFRLAIDYLSVPASSAAVERQFSRAKHIHSPVRQAMGRRHLDTLVFLREHLEVFDPLDATGTGTSRG